MPISTPTTTTSGDTESQEKWKKYFEYTCEVDQDDRAIEMKFCNFARPHMRAFHCCLWGFFSACLIWFAINPLLPEIRTSLNLTTSQIWTSSVSCMIGTLFIRLLLGPMCDKFGPRVLFSLVLCCASIPTAFIGMINTSTGLVIIRTFIGFAGGVFVCCQGWTNAMFADQTIGSAISIVAGWGNFASGITQLVVGSALFPLFKLLFDGDVEKAWRTVAVLPATVAFAVGVIMYFISDDTPRGNYSEMKKHGVMVDVSAIRSFGSGIKDMKTWLLFIQNSCATGVELTIHNASAMYFQDKFDMSTESAAAIASILGWMGLCCALGGYCSDKANSKMGLHGRLCVQTSVLVCSGSLILVFANTSTLGGAIVAMVFLSLFIQVSEGTTYSLVPTVEPGNSSSGSVSGIVSAGGNVGAIAFGIVFRQLDYGRAFTVMGVCTMLSSLLSVFMTVDSLSSSSLCFCNKKVDSTDEDSFPSVAVQLIKPTSGGFSCSNTMIHESPQSSMMETRTSVYSTAVHLVEISRPALLENAKFFRRLCSNNCQLMAVVKSNAYGHGLENIVPVLSGQVDWFGVNSVFEADRVRMIDSGTPILIIGMNAWDLEQSGGIKLPIGTTFVVSSIQAIQTLQEKAPGVSFHLAVDTGLSRLGVQGAELDRTLDFLANNKKLPWTGILTHFTDANALAMLDQLSQFEEVLEKAEAAAGQSRPLTVHAAASAGALLLPELSRLDMIRVGIGLYGLWPSPEIQEELFMSTLSPGKKSRVLLPVMQWKSRLVHCHLIPAGSRVGYCGTYQVNRKTRIGVVPVGYYEGYDPALSNRSDVLVHGQRCHVVGRVSMNMITVDITDVTDVFEGDEVVLLGRDGNEQITADELAKLIGTTSYEVVSRVNDSLPRLTVD